MITGVGTLPHTSSDAPGEVPDHELVTAFQAHGLPLNATLVEMLNEHFSHRTERRGCGYTQATRHLADLINRPPAQHREAVTKLFARGVRAVTESDTATTTVAQVVDALTAASAREESLLLARLIADVVHRAAAGPPVLGETLAAFRPDLVLYQAGADTHVDDPMGGLLTTEQMRERDRGVFAATRALGIPVAWNLAGGYQVEPDGSIPRVIALHLNTFEEALRVWQRL